MINNPISFFFSFQSRNLEFLLADAISQGCDTVVRAGGVQSNHSRATAIAARELGLDAHLLLWGNEKDKVISLCMTLHASS